MYVSGSTCIFGVAPLSFRSAFVNARQPRTAYRLLPQSVALHCALARATPSRRTPATWPRRRRPWAPNIGRITTGCGVGIDAFASPICDHAMNPPLMTSSGLTPKNAGCHSTRSASLPTSTDPISPRDAVRDRGVDRVLRHVAPNPQVVVRALLAGERSALLTHLVRGLPRARHDFADAPHRLAVTRDHADSAKVVQDVFRRDGFVADAALGKRDVLRNVLVEMVADHQHVEVLVERVDGKRARGIRRARQHVRFAAHADDVGRMSATGALCVVRVDRAPFERRDRSRRRSPTRSACLCESRPARRIGPPRTGSNRWRQAWNPSLRAASIRWRPPESAREAPPASSCCLCREIQSSSGTRRSPAASSRDTTAPGVHVVAFVPVAGPVPPPMNVVTPLASATSICCGQM